MSLICIETEQLIIYDDLLYAGTHGNAETFSALSGESVAQIPESLRRITKCAHGEDGIDVHYGYSTRNFNGAFTISGFRPGDFFFSVSPDAAEKYLPKLYRQLHGSHPQSA